MGPAPGAPDAGSDVEGGESPDVGAPPVAGVDGVAPAPSPEEGVAGPAGGGGPPPAEGST
ncbi:MAG: hypothetical protein ACK559_25605 [bacterium]